MNNENVQPQDKVESSLLPGSSQFNNTYQAIQARATRLPDKTAISFFLKGQDYASGFEIKYNELLAKINQTANFLHGLGLTEDDVVAFILPNLPETHYVMWGGEAACQIFAINPLQEPEQIKELINASGAKAVVTMNPMPKMDLWEKLHGILPELPNIQHVIGVDIAHYVTGIQGLAAKALQLAKRSTIKMPNGKRYYNFTSSISHHEQHQLGFSRSFNEKTISSLFCTGGTTGLPKIALRTHKNELANAQSVMASGTSLLHEDSCILAGLPLFHVNGALITGLIPFMTGANVVIMTPQGYRGENVFENFWNVIEHFRVNTFSAVPTVYSALMNFPIEGKDLSSLEYCLCGAAPMPVETFKAFEAKIGVRILEGYGLTEATCVSSINPPEGERKVGSIGVSVQGQQMVCAHIDDNNRLDRHCNINEIGNLLVRGPNVFLGYIHANQNKDLWVTDKQGNTWLNSGDLARQDEDGYFWLTGRKKELIVRGGHNIEPKIIEEIMCQHPAVNLAAAVGQPDAHAGEVPVCYVQITQGNQVTEQELLAFAQHNVHERAAIPKQVYVLDELPVTAVGKVFKPKLEMMEIEKCILQTLASHEADRQCSVNVYQDPLHGLFADITIANAGQDQLIKLRKELGRHTFKFAIKNSAA